MVIVPSVTLSQGALTRVDWTYVGADGSEVGVQPFMTAVELEVHGVVGDRLVRLYAATAAPDAPFHVLSQNLSWDQVTTVALAFRDDLGNVYRSFFTTGTAPARPCSRSRPRRGRRARR